MAAAYAALVSLLNTLDQIQIHPLLSTSFNNYPNESFRQKIDFLVDFVENYSDVGSCGEAEDLVRRIAVLALKAIDIIEVRAANRVRAATSTRNGLRKFCKLKKIIADRIRAATSTQQSRTFWPKLQRIIDEMDSIKEQIFKIQDESGNQQPTSSSSPSATSSVENDSEAQDLAVVADEIILVPVCDEQSSSLLSNLQNRKEDMDSIKAEEETGSLNQQRTSSSSSAKTTDMVGFDGYLEQLLDQLTGQPSRRQILPIVGMGGIGKTTLARNVYNNLLIVEHFYVRAWVTVSQEFNLSEILLQALSCLGGSTSKTNKTDCELGEELHKALNGRKYLIVLDDVWSVEAWDEVKFFFPENNNGSRIVITTRQLELIGYFGSFALAMKILNDKNSWKLFCEKTFGREGCPPELEDVGHKIVRKCQGLPLAIAVVGGLLGKSPRTLEYWEEIMKDKSLILDSGEGNTPWSILYLSYKYMPVWLKSCFLYLGLFPEDYRIRVSQLIKLWIADGFIKSNIDKSLEEVAENYVNELVDRNLILVGGLKVNKKLKTCFVHDVVRDLCVRIAEKEQFYCVQRDIDGKCHFIVDQRTARFYCPESHTSASLVSPLIIDGQRQSRFNSRLLRVMISDGNSTTLDPLRQVNLRFLFHVSDYDLYKIPPSVSRLWSLQTLIVKQLLGVTAPCEIWEMPQLKHINIKDLVHLPHPPSHDEFVLQNLQTLARVRDLILTEEVCKRIPNIRKLGIISYANAQGEEASCSRYHLRNVGCFSKLESMRCSGYRYEYEGDFFRNVKLPSSLKKLTLENCRLVWSDIAMIASLPHLQILKLLDHAVVGAEWDCGEVEFLCLRHLRISRCGDLIHWSADRSNFPVLETLNLEFLYELEEIPPGIGEVPTLQKIQMFECSKSALFSAVKILEEQESFGNFGLQLDFMFDYASQAITQLEEIKESGITCQNLRFLASSTYYQASIMYAR